MKIVSNKRYDELIKAKKELDILHQLFKRRRVCGDHASKEANRLGIPFHLATNSIYDVIDRYFSETKK